MSANPAADTETVAKPAAPAPLISVVVPTHNPSAGLLQGLEDALVQQSLPNDQWELCIVDNASDSPVRIDQGKFREAGIASRCVKEPRPGLTFARLAGFANTTGEIIVMLDDDNRPKPDYLEQTVIFAKQHPQIGAFGGKSLPRFSRPPPAWFEASEISLGCRDLGDELQVFQPSPDHAIEAYPEISPIGAGMALRRKPAEAYARTISDRKNDIITDRVGTQLASGGDCDIVLTTLRHGWGIAYVPQLELDHLIAAGRLELPYLKRMAFDSNRSWVQVLAAHGIRPWPSIATWTLPLRELKAWWHFRPSQGPLATLAWHGARGRLKGQTEI